MTAIAVEPLIAEAKRRASRRRLLALAAGAVGVAATLSLWPSASTESSVFSNAGIHVSVPAGWYVTRRPFTGVTWPIQRFVVSSYRLPTSRLESAGASTDMPSSSGVLADIEEESPPSRSPVWKPLGVLRVGRLGGMETFTGRRWAELVFSRGGRHFYAFVWIGRDAPAAESRQLLSVLEQMTVK